MDIEILNLFYNEFDLLSKETSPRTPHILLEGFKKQDPKDSKLTLFGALLKSLLHDNTSFSTLPSPAEDLLSELQNHLLWVTYHYHFPQIQFSARESRNWIAILHCNQPLVETIHRDVPKHLSTDPNDPYFILPPTMILNYLLSGSQKYHDLLRRPWLFHSGEVQSRENLCPENKCESCSLVCVFVGSVPEQQQPQLLLQYSDNDTNLITQQVNQPRKLIDLINSEPTSRNHSISDEAILRGYRRFAPYIFEEELSCTYYVRQPLYVNTEKNIISDVYFAFKDIECRHTEQLIQTNRNGIKLVSSLVTGKVAYHLFERSDDKIELFLWPPTIMNKWFSNNGPVGHNFTDHNSGCLQQEGVRTNFYNHGELKKQFRDYLQNLFQFAPPDHWFNDEKVGDEPCALSQLFESLKGFVGTACEVNTSTNGHHRLDLNGALFLLCAVDKRIAEKVKNVTLIRGQGKSVILPSQESAQARKSAIMLFELFKVLSFDKSHRENLIVENVKIVKKSRSLIIDFNFDPSTSSTKSMLEKLTNFDTSGDSCSSFFNFLMASRIDKNNNRKTQCTVDLIKKETNDNKKMARLIIRAC